MPKKFQIIEVPDNVAREQEQMGTKPKFWYDDGTHGYCLYKEGHPNTGEDWAERVVSELCELLALPREATDHEGCGLFYHKICSARAFCTLQE